MKDLYTYTASETEHKRIYDAVIAAYQNIFNKVGIGQKTYLTFASGGAFTQFSHEFQTILDSGEDTVFIDEEKKIAVNKEVCTDDILKELDLKLDDLKERQAAEVGNIFSFGGRKSEQLGLFFKDESGAQQPVILGSYGIGITRLLGVIAEVLSDDKGLIWPHEISPFHVHLLLLSENARQKAEEIYSVFVSKGIDTLYDDRHFSSGEKFADADLIGLPLQILVGEKTLKSGMLEIKDRKSGTIEHSSLQNIVIRLLREFSIPTS